MENKGWSSGGTSSTVPKGGSPKCKECGMYCKSVDKCAWIDKATGKVSPTLFAKAPMNRFVHPDGYYIPSPSAMTKMESFWFPHFNITENQEKIRLIAEVKAAMIAIPYAGPAGSGSSKTVNFAAKEEVEAGFKMVADQMVNVAKTLNAISKTKSPDTKKSRRDDDKTN